MILSILTKPYPFSNPGINKWKLILSFGIFITLFLYIFQPFGLSDVQSKHKAYIFIGYGFVTMLILTFNIIIELIFSNIFNEKKWVVYKQILWVLWITFTIGLGNLIYSRMIFSFSIFNLHNIVVFQFVTLAVAVLPLTALVLYTQNKYLKQNVVSATSLNEGLQRIDNKQKTDSEIITLWSENRKENISVEANKLYYIESIGNYVKVYYSKETKTEAQILRSTLTRIQENLKSYKNFFKCHRAYLVNISKIDKVTGNAQGYRLKLLNSDVAVPVARSYIKEFNERLQNRGI
ncbi:MAG: LytTR family transcriptional regulator [Chlorobi bacterium]|nr:LytTR family transcriptional regulator [Chlorobiota bacterium]